MKAMGMESITTNRQLPLTLVEKGIHWICYLAYMTPFNLFGTEK
jgi:hypothetical protein|tara:strand:- start:1165 stop:1296 length:132 start_codon:yes stop_codon:yes gene_type:complete